MVFINLPGWVFMDSSPGFRPSRTMLYGSFVVCVNYSTRYDDFLRRSLGTAALEMAGTKIEDVENAEKPLTSSIRMAIGHSKIVPIDSVRICAVKEGKEGAILNQGHRFQNPLPKLP